MSLYLDERITLKPFLKLSKSEKSVLVLSWFVGEGYSEDVLQEYLVTEDTKLVKTAPDSVLDEQVEIHIVENLCTSTAFNRIKEIYLNKKRNPRWKCGTCKKNFKKGDRSMVCEHCLIWSHFNCTGEKKKPKGDWFCAKCLKRFLKG